MIEGLKHDMNHNQSVILECHIRAINTELDQITLNESAAGDKVQAISNKAREALQILIDKFSDYLNAILKKIRDGIVGAAAEKVLKYKDDIKKIQVSELKDISMSIPTGVMIPTWPNPEVGIDRLQKIVDTVIMVYEKEVSKLRGSAEYTAKTFTNPIKLMDAETIRKNLVDKIFEYKFSDDDVENVSTMNEKLKKMLIGEQKPCSGNNINTTVLLDNVEFLPETIDKTQKCLTKVKQLQSTFEKQLSEIPDNQHMTAVNTHVTNSISEYLGLLRCSIEIFNQRYLISVKALSYVLKQVESLRESIEINEEFEAIQESITEIDNEFAEYMKERNSHTAFGIVMLEAAEEDGKESRWVKMKEKIIGILKKISNMISTLVANQRNRIKMMKEKLLTNNKTAKSTENQDKSITIQENSKLLSEPQYSIYINKIDHEFTKIINEMELAVSNLERGNGEPIKFYDGPRKEEILHNVLGVDLEQSEFHEKLMELCLGENIQMSIDLSKSDIFDDIEKTAKKIIPIYENLTEKLEKAKRVNDELYNRFDKCDINQDYITNSRAILDMSHVCSYCILLMTNTGVLMDTHLKLLNNLKNTIENLVKLQNN